MTDNQPTPSSFPSVMDAVRAGGHKLIKLSGLWGASKALFLHELAGVSTAPLLVVSPTAKEALTLHKDFIFFAGKAGVSASHSFFPPWDVLPYDVIDPDPSIVAARVKALRAVSTGESRLLFAPVKAIMQRLARPGALVGAEAELYLLKGYDFIHEDIIKRLEAGGYSRNTAVYEPCEYAVRGGIIDVYPSNSELPIRVEFFGDTIESIRTFDPETQRSIDELDEAAIFPAKEAGVGGNGGGLEGYEANVTDYFMLKPFIVVDEPARVASQAAEFQSRVFTSFAESGGMNKARPDDLYIPADALANLFETHTSVHIESLAIEGGSGGAFAVNIPTRSIDGLRMREAAPEPWPDAVPRTPMAIFCANLRELRKGRAIVIAAPTKGQSDRLRDILGEQGIPAREGAFTTAPDATDTAVRIVTGELSAGFVMDPPGLAFITSTEIFGEKTNHGPAPRSKVERFLTTLAELKPGDYVVHVDNGIGKYLGLKRVKLMGVETDFLELIYSNSDRLYVPVDELGKVQKYIGAESASPSLDKLGGVSWEKTKSRAKRAVAEIAKELIELYAARAIAPGFAYSADDHLYREMEASFEYEETPDQARTIDEVKKDLESPHPMDRLVCGDVGYGKTEVAVRAAFKVVLDGKQAAILVPTTLLAEQHYNTFKDRLGPFPVRVEMLSRFTDKARVKEIKAGIADGSVDIIIGTHRLLQKDITFSDLGLLVIDEEHRFGVSHKEKLKQLRKQIDVLTLTATPIPRTLNMSISGIRDLSVIETPPPDRQPIKTIVSRFDRPKIREAIMREHMRGGQVFFVHNRIESIFTIGATLQAIVPEVSIGVAHGRMHEDALEAIMKDFIAGNYDVLLSTSIIESGLDIPNANTIIIDRADRFGLADLYQLRGRVGRARARGYCYLLVPGEDSLTETAQKRLRVLSELTELGAGFKLALHDLELRGAGNILGAEQSGHIGAIGFELYTRLLEEAVNELKGVMTEERIDPALDLKISAFMPEKYIPETSERLNVYKRLSSAETDIELNALVAELKDRYGPMPHEARRLIEVMEIRVLSKMMRVGGVSVLPYEIKITFTSRTNVDTNKLVRFMQKNRGKARYVKEYSLYLTKPGDSWEVVHATIRNCLKELA